MVYALTIDSTTFPAAKFSNIGTVLNIALPLTMAGAAMIFLAMTLMAAFNIITHGDNPDALKKVYSSLIFSVVGILIVMSSYLVVRVIGGIIGAQLLP